MNQQEAVQLYLTAYKKAAEPPHPKETGFLYQDTPATTAPSPAESSQDDQKSRTASRDSSKATEKAAEKSSDKGPKARGMSPLTYGLVGGGAAAAAGSGIALLFALRKRAKQKSEQARSGK